MLNTSKKKLVVIIIVTVLTVALSLSALSYSWFVQQVVLERSHIFPATGFEILQFESEVSQSAQEGKLYPATLKRSYFQDGFDLDYYNYDVIPRDGILPEYVEKAAGQVNFKVDLSYWSGLESLENAYQSIKIEQSIKLKEAGVGGKTNRDFSKTGEIALSIGFKEHDKSIFISESEPVLRRGQFLREDSVLIADSLGRNHHYRITDQLIFSEDNKTINFGAHHKSCYSLVGDEYKVNLASASAYHNVSGGINLMAYAENFMCYRDSTNGKDYFDNPDCLTQQTLNGITVHAFRFVKKDSPISFDGDTYRVRDVLVPGAAATFATERIYKHKNSNELMITKVGDTPSPSDWDLLYYPGAPQTLYSGYLEEIGNDIYIKKDVQLTQRNVLYDNGATVTPTSGIETSVLTHEYFDKSNTNVVSEQLNFCYIFDDGTQRDLPVSKSLLSTFFVKNSTIGYFRNGHFLHSSFSKYAPVAGDELLFLHNQTDEISPGEGVDANGDPIVDDDRAAISDIIVDLDHIVYKRGGILTRFIDKSIDFDASNPGNHIIFMDGDFLSYDTDITSLETYKGKYLLTKVYLLSENIVVLRNNRLRVFTAYTPADGDIVLYQSGSATAHPLAASYIKNDSGGDYVENVFLYIGEYAYKDLTTYKDHVISAEVLPSDANKKPIVFREKLIMGRDSTFLLDIAMYIAVFDEDFDPTLKGETFVLSLDATFEDIP